MYNNRTIKSVFLSISILNIVNEFDKIYIYSPTRHQVLYQKLRKCFSNYIPIHKIPNNSNEEDIDIVIEEIDNKKDSEKSCTEIEIYESKEELKILQEYENKSIIILDDINQKEMDDPRGHARFKRSKHNNLSIFIISHDYYELSEKQYAAMVMSFIYSNRTISEMY